MAVWPQGLPRVCEDLPRRQLENATSFHLLAASFQFFGLSVPLPLSLSQPGFRSFKLGDCHKLASLSWQLSQAEHTQLGHRVC